MSLIDVDGGSGLQGKHHAGTNPNFGTETDAGRPVPPAANPQDSDETGDGEGVLSLLEKAGSLVLPIGIALYALLHLGIEQVYGQFNVTPEQVGVDQSILFGRLVGSIILLILAGALLLGPVVAIGWLIHKASFGHAARLVRAVRGRPWAAGALGAVWCGATYWGFIGFLGLAESVSAVSIVLVATAIGVLAFLVPFRLLRSRPLGRAGMKVVVGAFTGIGLGFALIGSMESSARDLAESGRPSVLLPFVGFQDQWVVASQREKGTVLRDGRPLLLLGESNGVYALYDCAQQETFRISMEATVLSQLQFTPETEDFDCRNPQTAPQATQETTPETTPEATTS